LSAVDRTLSILFTDVVGSTELFSTVAAAEAERLRQVHLQRLTAEVEIFSGRVVKNVGDGLMLAFESARDCVDCAIAIQRASLPAIRGWTLPVRVGIASGDVHIEGADCFGVAVVEASRLCALARRQQVLLAESTRLLARNHVPLREIGPLELKGLAEPTRAWEVAWSTERGAIRAVIADDATLVREGIAQVMESVGIEVVGQATDGEELLRLVDELRPDVAIVDVRMPPTHTDEGLRAAMSIRRLHPRTGTLVLSQNLEPEYARRLVAANGQGVGYLLKEGVTNSWGFARAIRRVASGGTAFEPGLLHRIGAGVE
jgi:class 3 adenylate cyclase/CheY-like chemotaxis protein